MKFVWYDKSYTKASYRSLDNALLNSHFTLFLFKPIKRGKLEELDDYLEYQDQKMERLNLSYTKEHSEYLKENCEKVLEALLKSTIVNILTESNLKNESTIKNRVIESERFDFETFSKDFTLEDIRNISKTEKLVHPSERLRERHDEEEDYDEEDFKTRVEDFLKKGDIKILREDVDTDYEPNKIKFIIRIPHGSENDIGSKRYWYQKNGYEYKDIPEGDMRNINIEITYEKIKDITSEIKEDYGKLKVGEIPNVGEEKTIRGEKGEKIYAQPPTEKVNVARDSYLKFVRARLNDLEDAIRNIPDGE